MYPQFLLHWISEWYWNYTVVLAQQVDVDIIQDFQNTWNNLLETGQLWAFLIGVGLGWWIRSVLP
jgi:hypothetical protein